MAIAYLGYRVDSKQVATAEKRLDKMSGAAGVATKAARGFMAAAAAAFSAGALVRGISQFEESMSKVAAVSRATEQQLATMRDTARELGSTTEFSASQAADGLNFLAMAGFNATESVAAISDVLDLATASGMGLASAADIASNVISGFGLAATDAAEVSDTLAAASSRANTNVAQLGGAMSTVAPIAASLDISLQDAAAAIGVLSDAGIQGERAGTAMRGVLASLAGPTDHAREAIEAYGIAVSDVDPATNDLTDIMGRFSDVGLSAADAMTIFGREAASGALALVGASDRIGELSAELSGAEGAAGDMADTMRDNLGGDIKGLMSALEGLILSLGDAGLSAVLRGVIQAVTDLVRVVGSGIDAFSNMFTRINELMNPMTELEVATSNVVLAMADEIDQSQQLSIALGQTNAMSVDAARVKLEEAKSRHENVTAIIAEHRALALGSEEYARISEQIKVVSDGLRSISAAPDTLVAPGKIAGYERLEQTLLGLRREQAALLQSDQALSDQASLTAENIDKIETALANASGGLVSFGDEMVTPVELSERLGVSLASASGELSDLEPAIISATNAVSDMGDAVRDDLSRAWSDFVDRGLRDFDSFGRQILKSFGNMLFQMAMTAKQNPISIGMSMLGGGMASAGGGGTGQLLSAGLNALSGGAIAGAGGLAGLGSAALGGAQFVASGFMSGGLAGAGSALATAASGATLGIGGAAAALGAVALPLAAVAATIMFFKKSTKELDNGLKVAIDGIDATAQTFKKIETSRFFGLSKKRRTTFQADPDNPVLGAVASIQDGVLQAARVMGVGSKAFEDFAFNFKLSLKGLTEEQKLQKINSELAKMGDEFASIVPNFSNMNDLLEAANRAVAETAAMGSTRFESQVLAAARRRGEITMDRSGPGFAEGQSLIRLQKLEEIDTKVEENTRQNNRLTQKMVDLLERWEEVGIPRGPVLT